MNAKHGEFVALHRKGEPLVLPNAWDVASALIVEAAGARAVATTSAGVAWSLGSADGDQLARDRAVDLVARIAAAVRVPVTADIEGGYATTAEGVRETASLVAEAGAVGVNIEDADHGGTAALLEIGAQADRIAAAASVGDLFVNARIDTYLRGLASPFDETAKRAEAYLAAGAHGIFVPGFIDTDAISALTARLDAPVNIMIWPGAPSVSALAAAGVARVSAGSGLAQAAYTIARRGAEEMLREGTYDALAGDDFGTLNGLFR
ncbi:isocitrate lyase/PEP mutase family protein [Amycolatopsis sp. CA-230715]|uniref:isocitrate lyase/PEP mutase family protein n=1 Tax=Amycolatopsis sp. CA-230715 TaxID=2745196 RepID=UPI001C0253E1|nr:isocitrate lyase/phosphoenolpyruvate mutase family protein [Amycolatopsis sp. CA-230715]QWF81807.1 hypothetical protein HUW46_05240 [Amycolatopsis sp. CA-230715]